MSAAAASETKPHGTQPLTAAKHPRAQHADQKLIHATQHVPVRNVTWVEVVGGRHPAQHDDQHDRGERPAHTVALDEAVQERKHQVELRLDNSIATAQNIVEYAPRSIEPV
jgi:hypothetical protein